MPSALGTMTLVEGVSAAGPLKADRITLVGDSLTPALGTTGFLAAFRALKKETANIIAVIPQDCAGYVPAYDHANDKLLVYYSNSDAADGPLIPVPDNTDLDAFTFNLVVLSY